MPQIFEFGDYGFGLLAKLLSGNSQTVKHLAAQSQCVGNPVSAETRLVGKPAQPPEAFWFLDVVMGNK
jgi:hypothetical protein